MSGKSSAFAAAQDAAVKRGLILPDAPLMQGLLAAARGRGKQSPRAAGAKYAVAFRHARRRQLHGVNSNAMYIYLFALAALCYAVSACLPSERRAAIAVGTLAGWLLHGGALWNDVIGVDTLRLGFAVMLSCTLWISVAAYWLENRNFTLDGLRVLVLPCAAVAVMLPAVFPGSVVLLQGRSALFPWHIAIATLAYSTLTIAAFHAILMALQESKLHMRSTTRKTGWFALTIDRLPALLTMEKLLFRLIGFGFVLLTLTVLSGVIFSEELFGQAFKWDHKNTFTMLSWLLFGVLLAGRKWRGWRGRTALSFALTGFTTLLLAYVGSRFVFEVVLHRSLA